MLNSVRHRLTLWFSIVMIAVLLGFAVATYAAIREYATRRTDSTLAELGDSFLTTLFDELRDEPDPTLQNAAQAAIDEHYSRDVIFVILDDQQKPLISSDTGSISPATAEGIQKLLQATRHEQWPNRIGRFHNVRVADQLYRGRAKDFTAAGRSYALVVLGSLHQQQEFLAEVGGTFAVLIPIVILLTSFGGYLLVKKSLDPVVVMSTQAERIGEGNIHERLPIKNEKDELGLLANSFNGLLTRVEQSMDRQRRFVADASHELRTPVAVLCGEAEVALSQESRSPEQYRESLEILEREAKRLRRIVEDLFTLARADAGQYPLSLSDFYLDDLAVDCCRSVRTLALAKGVDLRMQTAAESPVRADEALLRRMILNILDNAIKHTPRGGSVSIACSAESAYCSVQVTDTGSGIPVEAQSRIFERFFRADKVRPRSANDSANGALDESSGAGLGLSICRWIAEAHESQLELTQSSPAGSTFTLRIPMRIGATPAEHH